MFSFSREQVQRVGQQVRDCVERSDRTCRSAGQIQNQRIAADSAQRAAQGSVRSLLYPFAAHQFRNAVEQFLADFACRFGSDVARGDAGAAGGHYKFGARGCVAQRVAQIVKLIRKDGARQHFKSQLAK